tara:strand:+ start:1758 stop:2360 length:603 start_codon:yes stop_codon:yes gene_type:complete
MHLDLSEKKIEKLKSFSQAVIQRNKQHNLTGHKDPKSFFDNQIVDCVLAYKTCKNHLQKNIVDCGSGAGVPSVVWAILEPKKNLFSVDKNFKKIQFQKQIIQELALTNINAINEKIEKFILNEPHTTTFKAFSSIKNTIERTKHRNNQKNLIFLKKDNTKTKEEILDAAALLYDYKKHLYVHKKEKMVALEFYDNKNSNN